ncbi:DUF6746 family protein [Alishewanella tabrizica]|uniref:Soluble cytochrome b562 n=1 Tax=Alishewanella tabrizica TaxID=671278 RepID=A0ABQ2WTS5_9ALTE|nr:DUF6746 family protein [Alishewanella tabrizica]GGW71443.1 hypothetical protein GCM10008111_29320 [Alishewanella tabrizica]
MKSLYYIVLLGMLSLTSQASFANERPAHFKGETICNTQQAIASFNTANTQLAKLLAGELNPTTITEIHELTYTLENALALLPAADDTLKAVLEEVHLGSEVMDATRVRDNGQLYLQLAKKLQN